MTLNQTMSGVASPPQSWYVYSVYTSNKKGFRPNLPNQILPEI